jgi:hypothetical protein
MASSLNIVKEECMQHANLVVIAKYFDPVASVLKKKKIRTLRYIALIT